MHAFEYSGVDSRFNHVFNAAMYNHTTIVIKSILNLYKGFEHLKQLVDVGGGLGVTLNQIISKYPHINGINFDLPHVIGQAPSYPGMVLVCFISANSSSKLQYLEKIIVLFHKNACFR